MAINDEYEVKEPFRYWCQITLPLVYDDSLSYYELLNKVVWYLNNTIADVSVAEENIERLRTAFEELQDYVNNYFDELDIEQELQNILDEMVESGEFNDIVEPIVNNVVPGAVEEQLPGVVEEQLDDVVEEKLPGVVEEQLDDVVDDKIGDAVSDWLDENVDPVGSAVLVDSTLRISGAAADAKVTGDEIEALKEGKAPVVVESVNGGHFVDGADGLSVIKMTVGIDPVQDLHGYDYPWPAGARNMLDPSTVPDVNKFVRVSDGNEASPSSEGPIWRHSDYIPVTPGMVVFFGEINSTAASAGTAFYDSEKAFVSAFTATQQGNANNVWTVPEGTAFMRHSFRIDTGYNTEWENTVYIVLNSQPHEWCPYENVCPISGWTGTKVTRCRKNLFDFESANYNNNNLFLGGYPESGNTVVDGTFVLKAGTYTASANTNMTAWYLIDETGQIGLKYSSPVYTFTLSEEKAICLRCYMLNTGRKDAFAQYNIQLELGSTATDYEPYSGQVYEIEFPSEAGTVYGGKLDVISGVLTVDKANIASYAGETLPGDWISDRDAYESGATPTTGAQVVYDLATPITYQLTATQILTLLGENNVSADCGDITEIIYPCDTKLFIMKLLENLT